MKVIGITGQSGSGKTTVSEILNKRPNTKIINADKLAKKMTAEKSAYFEEIKEQFKEDGIVLENGKLNRPKLAALIYGNNEKLKQLNQITFKHLLPKIEAEICNAEKNIKLVVIDAPLLFEAGLDKLCDYTIAVQTSERLKIKRICERDHISEKTAKARLEIQQTNEFYRKKVDFVLMNDEHITIKVLEKEIYKILNEIENKE